MWRHNLRDAGGARFTTRHFERQIERLHARHLHTSSLYNLEQNGVALASLVRHKREFARLLARTVARGDYKLSPALITKRLIEDKQRTVFSLGLVDLIVHGAVTNLLQALMAPRLSPQVYSYRKGRSWWTAIADFAQYVRQHRHAHVDPRQRGLYVLRRDVYAYTDSIPVHPGSQLWGMLQELWSTTPPLTESERRLIVDVIRPEAFEIPERTFTLCRGVPTGLPVACVLFNLYLMRLDSALDSIPGAFYARYSDDLLFAHPDPSVVREADSTIERVLNELGLSANAEKRHDLYLTAAGRHSAVSPETRPAMAVPLLGCRISADGSVSVSRKKVRRLLRDVEHRAFRTAASCQAPDRHTAGRLVCMVVNRALLRRTDPFRPHVTDLLRRVVTDRRQLQQLDYRIARSVLRVVTGDGSARAFRAVPYRQMRRDWKLRSLVQIRNSTGRGSGS